MTHPMEGKHRLKGYTAEEFEADYLAGSNMTRDELRLHRFVAECHCRDEICTGWQMGYLYAGVGYLRPEAVLGSSGKGPT